MTVVARTIRFFSRRWRGEVALPLLLWRDTLAVGSVVNLCATAAALLLLARGASAHFAVALHFAPLPYNLFLCAALLRAPRRTTITSGIGLAWLAVMTVA